MVGLFVIAASQSSFKMEITGVILTRKSVPNISK